MEKDASSSSKKRKLIEMMKNTRFGEETRESMKMEKDLSSTSKTRLPSHFLTRQIVKMEKDASSTSKKRKLTKMMQNTRFGEAMGESMKLENNLSATSKTRLPSHFLMGETVKMDKDASLSSIERKFKGMMKNTRFGESMGESVKVEKDLSSTSKTKLPSHFLMRQTVTMEKDASSSSSKKRKLIELMKKTRFVEETGESMKMEKDLSSTSKTRLPSHSLTRQIVKMEKDASSTSKERNLTKMMQNTRFSEAMGESMKLENNLSSTSKTRLPSHFLMGETVKMEKEASPTSKERKLLEMMKNTRFGEVEKDLSSMSKTKLPSHFLIRQIVMMEKDASSTSKKRKLIEMMKKTRFGEETGESMKMEKDLSSTSKTRLSSHSLTRQIVKMEKDASSTSKERKLTKMMQNTRFGESMGESMKVEKDLSSMSKTKLPSHFLMRQTVTMEKDASSSSKKRKLIEMMKNTRFGEATGESMKMEKDLSSTRKTRLPSNFLMKETIKMEKDVSSTSNERNLIEMMKKTRFDKEMGESMKMEKDLLSTSITRLPYRFPMGGTLKMEKEASSTSKERKGPEMIKIIFGEATGETMKMGRCKALDIASKNNHIPVGTESVAPEPLRSGLQEGEPSRQRMFRVYEICEICCERKKTFDMFRNKDCIHYICTDCISKHIQVKVESNSSMILCPGLNCIVALSPKSCKEFLPKRVIERWERMVIETMILDTEKFYCPFKDCSATLLNDSAENMRMMRESECPHCRRLFCVQCRVPWHSGMECQEFQRLNADERGREDILLKKLAEEKKWMRCPQCKFYVEKTEGCVHMRCRCRFEFCYRCGGKWSINHGPCGVG